MGRGVQKVSHQKLFKSLSCSHIYALLRYEAEVEAEKRKSAEQLQPLKSQLSELEEQVSYYSHFNNSISSIIVLIQISDQVAKITSLKASILRNDDKIQNILKAVVSA